MADTSCEDSAVTSVDDRGVTATRSAPKTEHHYLAQIAILRALRDSGFPARLEHADAGLRGDAWRADVFCEARGRKIAFEVQLSQQTLDEYERRARRYERAGVKCLWLIRSPCHYFAFRKALIQRYRLPIHGPNATKWPGVRHLPAIPLDVGDKTRPSIESMKVHVFRRSSVDRLQIGEFAVGVANGLLSFSTGEWRWK